MWCFYFFFLRYILLFELYEDENLENFVFNLSVRGKGVRCF